MRRGSALLLMFVAMAPGGAEEPAAVKPVTVPFELLKTRHLAVRIKLNGQGPYRVIFDTGAPVNLLNSRTARASGLLDKKAPTGGGFGLFATAQVRVQELEVGGLKAADVPWVIMDHPTVEAIHQALGPIEGILGFPFFARYRMTLDYQAKELTFVPNGFQPRDPLASILKIALSPDKPPPRLLASSALWGLVVHKDKDDAAAGVTVAVVLPRGPAAQAGFRPGDRLLTLDGRWTDTVEDCYEAAGHVPAGATVPAVVRRGNQELRLQVTPREGL